MDEILSAKEAARYLRIAQPTFYRYIREESIPATKIGGRWKFKRSVLEAWLEQRMHDGAMVAPSLEDAAAVSH